MEAGDLDAVLAIAASLKAAPNWPRASYEAAIAPAQSPQRIALVAETGDSQIAGFLVATIIPPESELESIAVSASHQRRGIARALFAELQMRLPQQGCREILLEVRASNRTALAFYAALGFVPTGRRPNYYADPAEDAVLMRRDLDPPEV